MRWAFKLALLLRLAVVLVASRAPRVLQVPEHEPPYRAAGFSHRVSFLTSSDLAAPKAEEPELSPDKIQEKSEQGIERTGKSQQDVSEQKLEADSEMTKIMNEARSHVVNVVFFIGVLLILCCCMCCLFYSTREIDGSLSNPIVDVVKEDRLKLQAQQPQYVKDVVNSLQFQSWSDSLFERYVPEGDGTVDLRDLRDVVIEAYGRDVGNHWLFVKAFDSKHPERISCDEFLQIMMYFECQQYEDSHRLSSIPGLVMAESVPLQVSRTPPPDTKKSNQTEASSSGPYW